jgi:hypothetical protein
MAMRYVQPFEEQVVITAEVAEALDGRAQHGRGKHGREREESGPALHGGLLQGRPIRLHRRRNGLALSGKVRPIIAGPKRSGQGL